MLFAICPWVFRTVIPSDAGNKALTPSGIPTVFAVSSLFNEFGILPADSGGVMDFQTSVVFVLIALLAFPLALRQLTHFRR